MSQPRIIYWMRQDLRLADNPALCAAALHGDILPIYIQDTQHGQQYQHGAASKVWLHHALQQFEQSLSHPICYYQGDPLQLIPELVQRHNIQAVYWNRCYEPWQIQRDAQLKTLLKQQQVQVKSFNASLLWEPWQVLKKNGTAYRVFTPFYRKGCLQAAPPRAPLPPPATIHCLHDPAALGLEQLAFVPKHPWSKQLCQQWQIGEQGAQQQWQHFQQHGLTRYKEGRNYPAQHQVSRLAAHIHFGEISVHQLWHQLLDQQSDLQVEHFLSELGWREFSYHLLYHFPTLPTENLQRKFDRFPWQQSAHLLQAWQKGQTGVPMVDAGMRELWQTGFMHNRSRMIVGSFLVKNLQLDWRHGAQWFWQTLFDADLANNSAGWQWIAGCGADAAPYFRIFNPVTQGEKFDAQGDYIRRYIPEIAQLPTKYLFAPWLAPVAVLKQAQVEIGQTYPAPIVDLKQSREQALAAFASLKD